MSGQRPEHAIGAERAMAKKKARSSVSKKALRKLPDYGPELADARADAEKQHAAAGRAPDSSLFFTDTSGSNPARRNNTRSERKQKARSEPIAVDAVLQPNPLADPAPQPPSLRKRTSQPSTFSKARASKPPNSSPTFYDVWSSCPSHNRKWRPSKLSGSASRSVEPEGDASSYNPDPTAHSAAAAREAAQALRAQQRSRLHAREATHIMRSGQMERLLEEELVTAAPDTEDGTYELSENTEGNGELSACANETNAASKNDSIDAQADAHGIRECAADGEEGNEVRISVGPQPREQRKTKHEVNKKKRKREHLDEQAQRKALKKQRRDIDSVDEIQKEIEEHEQRLHALKMRREITRKQRRKQQPARLGPVQYQAEPKHILSMSEAGSSLRQLKGSAAILRERYRDMQRRELIEPRKHLNRRQRATMQVEAGNKAEREKELQQEIKTHLQTHKHL